MKKVLLFVLTLTLFACQPTKAINPTFEEVPIGNPAPDFSLMGSDGKTYKLSDYKGKVIVLEWTNFDCPFVKKHYNSKYKNMQNLQKKYTKQDVVWFSIISSAKGKQGYLEQADAQKKKSEKENNATALLLDPQGNVGSLYGAKTTPHMYVIDKQGLVAYRGAIDNKPTTEVEDIKGSNNFVAEALDAVLYGQKIMITSTPAYGCSVKY